MYKKIAVFCRKNLVSHVRNGLLAAIAIFMFCVSGANAAGYTCDTKVYVECNKDYYLSAYGARDNIAGLLAKDGSTLSNLGDSSECYACPTGCTCAGVKASPKCSYKITLDDNGGSGGSGAIYYSLGDSKYYKQINLTSQITSTTGAVAVPTKAYSVFEGYYNGSSQFITKTGLLGASVTAPSTGITVSASWTACTACSAGAGANCSLSVVNNACTYTTSCKTGYGSLTNSGAYNPSCTCTTLCTANIENKTSTQSCTPNNTVSNAHTTNCPSGSQTCAGFYTGGGCHSASDACTGCSVWGACSTTCTAASCKAGYYLESGACKSCDTGYSSADGMTSGRGYCYKDCAAKTGYTYKSGVDYFSATDTCAYTAHTYTVKYDANGGTGTTANSTHTYDAEINLTENGYTNGVKQFLGWSTNKSATTATYANKATVKNLTATNGGTVTLYAIWGADCTCSTGTGIASCTATAPLGVCGKADATAKTGYKNPTCDASTNGVSSCTATPITFTVKYVKSPDAATGTTPSQHTCNYDKDCTAAANPYAYTGYVFQHWGCAASSGNCASATYGAGKSMKNATSVDGATLTLTPKWTEGKWTITYKCGDGATGNPSTKTAEGMYNTDYTTAGLGTCAKTGHNSTKWMVSGTNDTKNLSTKYKWTYTENKTFTLDWDANTYTVKYSCGERAKGTPPDGISAEYDKSYEVASNKSCSKTGFKFLGSWKYDNKNYVSGEKTIKNLTDVNGATVTLTANYEPSKVGCPAGEMFDHANVKCISCKSGYYCAAWCLNDKGEANCDYNQSGIYANIGDNKYSKNFTGCPTKTTSDEGADTITMCYFDGKNNFKDKGGSFKIENIKSYVYVKQ